MANTASHEGWAETLADALLIEDVVERTSLHVRYRQWADNFSAHPDFTQALEMYPDFNRFEIAWLLNTAKSLELSWKEDIKLGRSKETGEAFLFEPAAKITANFERWIEAQGAKWWPLREYLVLDYDERVTQGAEDGDVVVCVVIADTVNVVAWQNVYERMEASGWARESILEIFGPPPQFCQTRAHGVWRASEGKPQYGSAYDMAKKRALKRAYTMRHPQSSLVVAAELAKTQKEIAQQVEAKPYTPSPPQPERTNSEKLGRRSLNDSIL